MLTFPLQCSHKLQPLDVAVCLLFKPFYDASVCSWFNRNPGVLPLIYDIPENINTALQRVTPSNILAGFLKARIFPFDRHVYVDYDFLPISVNDRSGPKSATSESIVTAGTVPDIPVTNDTASSEPSTSFALHPAVSETSTIALPELTSLESNGKATAVKFISLEQLKGHRKARSRENNNRGRANVKTIIATDTPEKDEIEKRASERSMRKEIFGLKRRKLWVKNRKEKFIISVKLKKLFLEQIQSQFSSKREEYCDIPNLFHLIPEHFLFSLVIS
jgi:hypothetical protein